MTESRSHSQALAAELLRILSAASVEHVAPGELLLALRGEPAWSAYLQVFESERGQAAAVGRFLVDAGLNKAGHHRTRGSLYDRTEAQTRLRAMLAADATPVLVAGAGAGTGAAGDAGPAGRPGPRRRHGESPQPARLHSGGHAGPAPAPLPMIGWRRRASDAQRSSARATPPEALPPNLSAAALGGGAAPPAPPPTWAGSGNAFGPPGAGGLYPYAVPDATIAAEDAGLPLSFYWTQIRRHLYKILVAAIAITVGVGLYTLKLPKRYESAVTLRVDFKAPALAAEANNNPAFDPTTIIQTEVMDVAQRSVILDAIHNAHLNRDPGLRLELGTPTDAMTPTTADPDAREDALVGLIQSQIRADSPGDTHNINIHFQSLNPVTSATVANALASALIFHEFQTRQQEQDDLLQFMKQQFVDVNARVEREQAALTAYQLKNNILNPDAQSSLENATLNALNSSYLAAQGALTQVQAEENMLRSGNLTDALLASDEGAALRPTYAAWRQAELQFEQVKATRGAANPAYEAAQQAVRDARTQLNAAIASTKAQIDIQYRRAQNQEQLVAKQLAAARMAMQSFNLKDLDYQTQKRDLDADQKLYNDLQAQIKQQQLTASLSDSGLRVTNPATPNYVAVYPNVRENIVLALLFSLFGGCALAVLAGTLDRSFTTPDTVEQYLRIPLLGALPVIADKQHLVELANQTAGPEAAPRSAFAESVLMLRTALLYAAPQGFRTLSITSAQPQEGKSVLAANLGVALALHGAKVLLMDTDVRRPTLHRLFEMNNHVGLANVLRQMAPLEDCFRATTVERLYVMPAGPAVANPGELLATMLPQVLAALTAEFDYVVLDSPPVLGFADAVSVATAVEATLLVARAGKTPREVVHAALQPLQRVRARVLGLVLNQVSSSLSPYYSYYHDHYARYYGERELAEHREEQP